jgi:hypothetical protein
MSGSLGQQAVPALGVAMAWAGTTSRHGSSWVIHGVIRFEALAIGREMRWMAVSLSSIRGPVSPRWHGAAAWLSILSDAALLRALFLPRSSHTVAR